MSRRFTSPEAFKRSLEQRLRDSTPTGVAFARRRQVLVFERFLARIDAELGDRATLKGGLVLEVRLERARTTKDVDLRMMGDSSGLLSTLQAAARRPIDDFLRFEVRPDAQHPDIQNDGVKYDGQRFRAECTLAGKPYGQPFGVDVAFGDPIFGKPDVVVAEDTLAFAGIAPPKIRLYPLETHVAEKLHAYTMPRARPNSRVKDLPDLGLLATVRTIDGTKLRAALEQTFTHRGTHRLPTSLPPPPEAWRRPYEAMAAEDGLPWATLEEVTVAAQAFLDPALTEALDVRWNPERWAWSARR